MSSHELIDELLRISAELEQTPGNAPEAYLLRDEYHRVHAQLVALGTKMRAETEKIQRGIKGLIPHEEGE